MTAIIQIKRSALTFSESRVARCRKLPGYRAMAFSGRVRPDYKPEGGIVKFRRFQGIQADFVALVARQPAGTGSAQILRSMSPNSRRQEPVVPRMLHQPAPSFDQPLAGDW